MELAHGAYGYPMLQGHMKDVVSNFKMHTLQKLSFDITTGMVCSFLIRAFALIEALTCV
jgi:hypothetical protein